jgi:hypothetical protein
MEKFENNSEKKEENKKEPEVKRNQPIGEKILTKILMFMLYPLIRGYKNYNC